MKILYILSLIILVAVLFVLAHKAYKKDTDIAKILAKLTCIVNLSIISGLLAIAIPSDPVALFFQTLRYASTEWLLIYFLAFLVGYAGLIVDNVRASMLIFIISALSSVSLLLNAVFGHVVYCFHDLSSGSNYRIFVTRFPGYNIHAVFSYSLVILGILILIRSTSRTIKFYRIKYIPAILALVLTVAVKCICNHFVVKVDYALYGYAGLTLFLIYFALYYDNKHLITSTLAYIASESQNGAICFNLENECIYANDIMWKLYPNATKSSDFERIFKAYLAPENQQLSSHDKWTITNVVNEENQYLELSTKKILDKHNDIIGTCFYLHDKTADVAAYNKAKYDASHDDLTDLYIGHSFNNLVADCISIKHEEAYILAADIKEFKLINDRYGFNKGNEILVAFANALKECLGENAICSRLNSDRFAFYVPKTDFDEQKILDSLAPLNGLLGDGNFQLVFHFGVYEIQPEDTEAPPMYDHARIALTYIKNDYDRSFCYYDSNMMHRLLREKELVGEFEKALEEKQFKMYLQPQISPEGKMIGAEALVRWISPTEGMISPGEFITTFEKTGLIHKLDEYMWDLAAAKLKAWIDNGKTDYYISVNISPKDFYYMDVYGTIVKIVEKYDIPPSKLKLEITESAFMNDPEKQLALIDKLQQYGFHVEIDDFGSGFSSLNMLKDMKADFLKIDMGFLRKTTETERAEIILDAIIKLARKLNMIIVTEGVETKDQVDYLATAGCDIFQGYYFDKPIAVADFENKYFN